MPAYRPVIGLEIHVRLDSRTKAFCACANDPSAAANRNTCPVCMGHPGALPLPAREFVRMGIAAALMADASISERLRFDRKNYFYPDLPKGYQITQAAEPIGRGGGISIVFDGELLRIPLRQVHIEEDAGRTIHRGDEIWLDFNRCGAPLAEFVTEPAINSPAEAAEVFREARRMMMFAGLTRGDMQSGDLRCDANISLESGGRPGVRTEIKNLNSFRHLERALEFEIKRQSALLDSRAEIISQTLSWNEDKHIVEPMRDKETTADYRYFPEPDIPDFFIEKEFIASIEMNLPELPAFSEWKLISHDGLSGGQAREISGTRGRLEFFRDCAIYINKDRVSFANFLTNDIFPKFEKKGSIQYNPETITGVYELTAGGRAGRESIGEIIKCMKQNGIDALSAARRLGALRDTSSELIGDAARRAIDENPEAVDNYINGKSKALGYLVGRAMAYTGGRVDPKLISQKIKEMISQKIR
ncbi:MAG: Asp-tRNA(Asn)/Glu-tRNA(Gln) amidotransferase subunit GatB [Candidatus Kapaibacterium sp.]